MEKDILDRKPKKKPSKIEEMSKEQIRQAIVKKRECNAKAQQIVESLLEKNINEVYFLQCLPDINQSHLDDVIEERSIIQICGYPLCQNSLSAKEIPKQKYKISLKTNKVFDITARKNFCSNSCFKSAMFIKKQMLTSPLWYRDYEQMPSFNLLPLDAVGCLGQEVDVSIIDKVDVKNVTNDFTSISDFTSAILNEISPNNNEKEEESETADKGNQGTNKEDGESGIKDEASNFSDSKPQTKNSIKGIQNDTPTNTNETKGLKLLTNTTELPTKTKPVKNPLNIVGEIVEKPERKIDPILSNPPENTKAEIKKQDKNVQKKQPSVTIVIIEVEKCLAEWFSLDTMLFLFGEEKVKEMVSAKGQCIREYLNNYSKSIFYSSNSYDQYQELCRKLNMLELEDRKLDTQALQRESKPLPDYSIIKEESKKMKLKVKAYLAGETEISEPAPGVTENTENSDQPLTQLPLVDKNAQNALRRRIVCEHLNKVLPDILCSLGMSAISLSSDVRLIVNTFKLKANNIMFKPMQWTLIAMIIIKLLSLRDRRLEYLLQQPTAFQHMQLLLLSYKQNGGYIERLVSWLTDIDRLLDTNDTQLTVDSSKEASCDM